MERWRNRVAVVTGASSGIGAAIAVDLVKSGLVVAGLARRVDRVEALRAPLPEHLRSHLHVVKCDVSNDDSVTAAFDWIDKNLGGVDVLVNNAGISNWGQAMTMDFKDMEDVVQTNLLGVVRCTRRAYKSMRERNFDGHIFVMNSVLGHHIQTGPRFGSALNVYPSTKFALTALCQVFAMEFLTAKTKIKITSVSPGMTDTEIVEPIKQKAIPMIKPEDISAAVLYALGTPQTVQVAEVTVQPIG